MFAYVLQNRCSQKLTKFHRKTPVLEKTPMLYYIHEKTPSYMFDRVPNIYLEYICNVSFRKCCNIVHYTKNGCNGCRTHNHLVPKRTLNHLPRVLDMIKTYRHKKLSFPLTISSINMTKSARN